MGITTMGVTALGVTKLGMTAMGTTTTWLSESNTSNAFSTLMQRREVVYLCPQLICCWKHRGICIACLTFGADIHVGV